MSLRVERLSFSYKKESVLDNITFTQQSGSLLCLLGPNGVGKSTLFRCILGLLPEYTGEVVIDGLDARTLSPRESARHIAFVPQSHASVFNYSVMDMVLMGTSARFSAFSVPGKQERLLAQQALEQAGISRLGDRPFMELSGGERQLVLIARALAQQARILIMDEPTANLDYGNQLRVLRQVKHLTQSGYTVMLSTHNPDQALLFADMVLTLQNGRVTAFGPPSDVLHEERLRSLYGMDIDLVRLYDGKVSVCVPRFAVSDIKTAEGNPRL